MERNTTGFSNTSFRGGDDSAAGLSNTSFRGGISDGYVPGANDGAIPHDSAAGLSNTSFRGGDDIPQNSSLGGTSFRGGDDFDSGLSNTSFRGGISDGYVAGSTGSGLADTSMRGSFDTPVYPPSQPGFGSHLDVATSGTSTRSSDHLDSRHHSKGGGLLGKLATKIFDNINSRVGPKHTDVAHSGTSTRSSDDHFGSGSSGDLGSGGTSFR